jgi:hypothetical protein
MAHSSLRRPGTLRKNVTLIQKSSKTSVEQSFLRGVPSRPQVSPTSNRADELMNKRLYPSIRATKATVTTRFGALFFI